MTGSELRAILLLNACFLAAGLSLLWGVRGWRTWLELLDAIGLGAVVGTCAVTVLATLVLIAGRGLPVWGILVLSGAVAATGLALGLRRKSPLPRSFGRLPRFTPASAMTAVATGAGMAATVVILVALYRVARVAPMGGGDSFEFWVPKAKVIYFDGRITGFFATLPGPRYPLYVPTLFGMDFRFMGSADAPVLAVQLWLLYASFVLAAASLLRRLVPTWLAWLFVALTGTIPELDGRLLGLQGDWTLDLEFSIAVLLLLAWLRLREGWLLVVLGIVLSALLSTKQEGLLLALCLGAATAAATARERRAVWPRLAVVALAAIDTYLPWRISWGVRHLPADGGPGTYGPIGLLTHLARGWQSLHLVLRLLFQYDMWLAFVPLALAAAVGALSVSKEARRNAVLYLGTLSTIVVAATWIPWSDPTMILDERQSSTPIPRLIGSVALLSTVLAPTLIAPLLRLRRTKDRGPGVPGPSVGTTETTA